jgi:hypothetical protein
MAPFAIDATHISGIVQRRTAAIASPERRTSVYRGRWLLTL